MIEYRKLIIVPGIGRYVSDAVTQEDIDNVLQQIKELEDISDTEMELVRISAIPFIIPNKGTNNV
jgi:hypothetical protein